MTVPHRRRSRIGEIVITTVLVALVVTAFGVALFRTVTP